MIGWAVVQQGLEQGEWNPITFGSRVLDTHEQNYPIHNLEQLAIIQGYKDNYHLLYAKPTYIFCDNKPSVTGQ